MFSSRFKSVFCMVIGRYEDDPIVGHRLYREIRKVEVIQVKKAKIKGSQCLPNVSYLWETVATNLDEFQDVSVSEKNLSFMLMIYHEFSVLNTT